ncbi:sensor domain-containing diguanylate cyclase [Oceanibacterium hippocampi]|uniref:Phytochrome-like protein cph2 n=1 Tax=Oceanibacterium hippocampi TaxID=745714 RepID=A0A1Y5RY58_9PROT|nr:diguanylate cyclase [Oceanibacterium hippocampi]SLN25335.1 Phytochrome-like protein cph2 [Oceanibacterium hippocampi]
MNVPLGLEAWDSAADAALPEALANLIEMFPGPAFLVDGDGVHMHGNVIAEPLLAVLDSLPLDAPLRRSLIQVVRSGKSVQRSMKLPDLMPERVYDLSLIPMPGDGQPVSLVLGRDVSVERNLKTALISAREMYKSLVECSADFAWETDARGQFSFVSPRGALGYSASELAGSPVARLFRPAADEIDPFQSSEPVDAHEIVAERADGKEAVLVASSRPYFGAGGAWRGCRGVCKDVTAERRQAAALARADERERLLGGIIAAIRAEVEASDMYDACLQRLVPAMAAGGAIIFRWPHAAGEGPVAVARLGVKARDALAVARTLPRDPDGRATIEMRSDDDNWLYAVCGTGKAPLGGIAVRRDRSRETWNGDERNLLERVGGHLGIALEQLDHREELLRLARTDPLSGLLNRHAFESELKMRLERFSEPHHAGALLYVDLDGFKKINDELGHHAGDEALVRVASILRTGSRAADLVSRYGGDEFVVWLHKTDLDGARKRAARLLSDIAELRASNPSLPSTFGASIGIAVGSGAGLKTVGALLQAADRAMYESKHKGRNMISVMDDAALRPGRGKGDA